MSADPGAAATGRTPRHAVVTGGSSGIGAAVARRLAGEGYELVLVARSVERLASTAASLRRTHGRPVHVVAADIATDHGTARVADLVASTCPGGVAVLVHAAGVGSAAPFADYPLRRVDLQWRLNARAVFSLTQALLPQLRVGSAASSRGARIVAVASIEGVVPEPGLMAYGMSKAAVIAWCASLNVEEHEHGISATAISPGYVDTAMSDWVADRIPPQTMIPADDVAELVVAVARMSRHVVVPHVVMTRAGGTLWRA